MWSLSPGPDIPVLTNYRSNPENDKSGKLNTKIIVDYINSNSGNLETDVPATYYCTSYSPGYKNGEWYLPSMGELKLFCDSREKFRSDCNTAGISTNMNSDSSGAHDFWSSTEYSIYNVWSFDFKNFSSFLWTNKSSSLYVVPFLAIN